MNAALTAYARHHDRREHGILAALERGAAHQRAGRHRPHWVAREVPVGSPEDGGLQHTALVYRSQDERLTGMAAFIRAALSRREVALAALPGPALAPLRETLGEGASAVTFADMTAVGRNPARIIPFISDVAASHPGQRIAFVGEPAWPGRSAAELAEAAKHEALINLAFTGLPLAILCPYHATGLPAEALSTAHQTHPRAFPRQAPVPQRGLSRP